MFGVKGKPWEGAGAVNVEDCQTAREVITKSKLNFTVAKCEVVAKMPIKDFSDEALDRFKEIIIYHLVMLNLNIQLFKI